MDLKVCKDLTTYLTFHLHRDWDWIWRSVRISLHTWQFIWTPTRDGSDLQTFLNLLHLYPYCELYRIATRATICSPNLKVCKDLTTYLTFHRHRDWDWIWRSVRISLHTWQFIWTLTGDGSELQTFSNLLHLYPYRELYRIATRATIRSPTLKVSKDLTTCLTVHLERD